MSITEVWRCVPNLLGVNILVRHRSASVSITSYPRCVSPPNFDNYRLRHKNLAGLRSVQVSLCNLIIDRAIAIFDLLEFGVPEHLQPVSMYLRQFQQTGSDVPAHACGSNERPVLARTDISHAGPRLLSVLISYGPNPATTCYWRAAAWPGR